MKPGNLIFIITIVCSLLYAEKALGCSCNKVVTFCEATSGTENDLIVSGEITYVDSIKLRLKIIDIFKGEETSDTITIWAGTDFDCNGVFSMSTIDLGQIGDSVVIILPRIVSTNIENDWDVVGDYRRPYYFCISPNLRLENDSVRGEIKDNWPMPSTMISKISYDFFKSLWYNGTIDCGTLTGVPQIESKEVDYSIINGRITIDNHENLDLLINIYDQTGRRLFSLKSNSIKIVTDQLSDNQTYMMQISHNGRQLTAAKIIIKN